MQTHFPAFLSQNTDYRIQRQRVNKAISFPLSMNVSLSCVAEINIKKNFVCEKIDNKQIKCIYPDFFFFPQVMTSYDLKTFFLLIIISLVLNQTWIAVYMMVICAHPGFASRICPMVSAIGGFAGGFLVPRPQMPAG